MAYRARGEGVSSRAPPSSTKPGEFRLIERPHVAVAPAFRFAFKRVSGAYEPWARHRALDDVAEALEIADVERSGPPFGIYYDLPWTDRDPEQWVADLGYPVPSRVRVPKDDDVRTRRVPARRVAALRYAGDQSSFPSALASLVESSAAVEAAGPLMERFHVSDPLSGQEERDVFVALDPLSESFR